MEVSRDAFGDGFLSLQITDASISGLNPARYDPAVAWFPFAAGWRGAHLDGDGTLAIANGVTQDMIEPVEPESDFVGRFHLDLRVNARSDGMLFAIGTSARGDRVVSTSVLSDDSGWDVRGSSTTKRLSPHRASRAHSACSTCHTTHRRSSVETTTA